MIQVAVVEDQEEERLRLRSYLEAYMAEHHVPLSVRLYTSGNDLLYDYRTGKFDIILLDIQMPGMDGMETARQIRTMDEKVLLLFITNLVHYAVEGYSVRALDFVVKPVSYPMFAAKLENALLRYGKQNAGAIRIRTLEGLVSLQPDEIRYAELTGRKLLIHTADRIWTCSSTLSELENKLGDSRFYKCHSAILVNLEYVRLIDTASVMVGQDVLPLSKHRRKEFMDALTRCLGSH